MDCCSKIDFAHFRTYSKVSSSLGSNLVPKSTNFLQNFDPKNTSETDFIFWRRFSPQSLPKRGPKGPKNALSELRKSALGPPWRHRDGMLVSKTLSQAPKLLILTSYIEHIWTPCSISSGCSDIISRPDLPCKAQLSIRISRFPVHNLQIRHQSAILAFLFII